MEIACCSSTATAASLLLVRRRRRSPFPFSSLALGSSFRGISISISISSCPSPYPRPRAPSPGRVALQCQCIFGLGVPELVVIAGVAALVFGPKQLPEIGRNIGKTVKGFQQAAKEFETELKKAPPESQPDGADPKKELETSTSSTKETL